MNLLTKPVLYALAALLALAVLWGGWQWRGKLAAQGDADQARLALSEYQRESAENLARFQAEARQQEHRHAADMARIGQEHREALTHAQTAADRLVADLRAGNVRMQERWRGCAAGLPGAVAGSGGADESAGLQAESVGRIDRAVSECEAQVRGLQAVTLADRQTGD